ncbi:MAG: hypothetical protein WA673_17820 [Candidatus Acidiferrales bacterium]
MKRMRWGLVALSAIALLLAMIAPRAAVQEANFVGTWDMTMSGGGGRGGQGGQGGGGGQEGGQARGGGEHGGWAQSLVIAKDGETFKVTHKTPRGDNTSDATVSGNTISWTEQRAGRDGETMKIDYKATIDGDTLKGTITGGRFNREFTAKRSS